VYKWLTHSKINSKVHSEACVAKSLSINAIRSTKTVLVDVDGSPRSVHMIQVRPNSSERIHTVMVEAVELTPTVTHTMSIVFMCDLLRVAGDMNLPKNPFKVKSRTWTERIFLFIYFEYFI
jgi:hypothetical protein